MIRIAMPDTDAADPYSFASRTHATEIMAAAAAFSKAVYQHTQLPLREFEGARYRIAQINGCMICQQFRSARDVQSMFAATGTRPAHLVSDNGPAPVHSSGMAASAATATQTMPAPGMCRRRANSRSKQHWLRLTKQSSRTRNSCS